MSIGAALKDVQRRRASLPFVSAEQKDPRAFYFTQDYQHHHVVLQFLPGPPDYRILTRHHVRMNGWTYRDEVCRDGCLVCAFEAETGQDLGDVKVRLLTNIVVLEDALHPENVGRVFLYECGEQIAKMVDT